MTDFETHPIGTADKIKRLEAVVGAAKTVTEYGEIAFMGVNIPFKNFTALKEALAALRQKDE